MTNWKTSVLNNQEQFEKEYEFIKGVYCHNKLIEELNDGIWNESVFFERSRKQYTTTWAEQVFSNELMDRNLSDLSIDMDCVIYDLGCGDGRFVHYLLDKGFNKIVALNYELEPLLKLAASLNDEQKEKVLIICGDIFMHPFKENSADFIIAWGLFTSTADFQQSRDKTIAMLKQGAYMYSAEPVLEHALIYALVMQDAAEFMTILKTKSRAIMWDQKKNRYRVYTQNEVNDFMGTSTLEILKKEGISLLPSLFFGGLQTQTNMDADQKEEYWELIKESDFSWYRQITFLTRKV